MDVEFAALVLPRASVFVLITLELMLAPACRDLACSEVPGECGGAFRATVTATATANDEPTQAFESGLWTIRAGSDFGEYVWECELVTIHSNCYFEEEDLNVVISASEMVFQSWNTEFQDAPGVHLLPEQFHLRVTPPSGDTRGKEWQFSPNYIGAEDCTECESHTELLSLEDLEIIN